MKVSQHPLIEYLSFYSKFLLGLAKNGKETVYKAEKVCLLFNGLIGTANGVIFFFRLIGKMRVFFFGGGGLASELNEQ